MKTVSYITYIVLAKVDVNSSGAANFLADMPSTAPAAVSDEVEYCNVSGGGIGRYNSHSLAQRKESMTETQRTCNREVNSVESDRLVVMVTAVMN